MDEKMKNSGEISEVNLKRLIDVLLKQLWKVILVSVTGAMIAFAITYFLITPLFQSSVMFYVNNSAISVGNASLSIDSGDISASKSLVSTYIVILNTRETLNDVIDYAGVERRYAEVVDMIEAEAVDDTEVFRVVVTSESPEEANKIADAISYILPKRISGIVEGTSAKVVDAAVVPASPSSPSFTVNTLLGFLLGFVLSAGIIVIREMGNVTIRSEEDISQVCKHPIFAAIPDMNSSGKGSSSYYGYGNSKSEKKKGKNTTDKQSNSHGTIGNDISFAASEAYKLLRTKLEFSFADENNCRVIGLSSALSGEGKSLTAINLAFALSQLNKKVLLVDCDMRRPTVAEKLGVLKKPGLSSFLTSQCFVNEMVQMCGINGNEKAFHVISAGENPPNPIELLSSERMKKALQGMREAYDYVIMDLPPVGEVSDAMAVAKEIDGILLVVRQNCCDRVALSETVRQFEFINAKILGIVFNCTNEESGNYSKRYYKRYYKSYYKRYGRNYEYSERTVSKPSNEGNA